MRSLFVALVVLMFFSGCKTGSKFAPLAFWRPQPAEPATYEEDSNSPTYPGLEEMTPPPASIPTLPLPPLEPIPPAPSFSEPQPTPAPPALFPME